MSAWSFYDLKTGLFTGSSYAGGADHLAGNTPPGCGAMQGVADWMAQRVDLQTGRVVAYQPPQPAGDAHQTWVWSAEASRWQAVPTLAALQAAKWTDIKAHRAQLLTTGTFTCAGLLYQCDQVNLAGAALDAFMAATAGQPWQQLWVLADNTTATLDAPAMIAAGRACKAYVASLWAITEALRAQIYAATTPEAVAAITWPI